MGINTPVPTWSKDDTLDTVQTEVRKAFSDLVLSINSDDGGTGTLIADLLSFPSKYGAGEFNFTSNSLGSCLDFADGNKTRIQWGVSPLIIPTSPIVSSYNYYEGSAVVTFPYQFTSIPFVIPGANRTVSSGNFMAYEQSVSTSQVTVIAVASNSTATGSIFWIAIGSRA